ncbi:MULTISPECIES: HAMP domain-containing sensor histidine kinase [Clostridium]|uniref:histidine kinase n=1 Tax=Clostridium cibarium TaxID=2762247 RepID=A0ABR8PXM2_9CLOT|nr:MULTISPECIES: HAMP domain-containing sensor histidine kinase [Clostridium]MBD7912910.1 HAMP domain-containing histidine kinase [Clostridium cibarium]
MAIKLKNKYTVGIAFVILIYILGISLLTANDLIKNKEYLKSDVYFTSSQFQHDLVSYFYNIKNLNEIYKDYSLKSTDDKVTNSELTLSKTLYDTDLSNREDEINGKYKYEIINAAQQDNKNEVKRLTEARDKELNEIKLENSKTIEDFKKEIVAYKNRDYENIKRAVEDKSIIKYYIADSKNNVIDTNIENISDIDEYIEKTALYSIKFPYEVKEFDKMTYINMWAEANNKKIYFVVSKDIDKNSFIYKNYNYYNSVKERLHKEIVIGIVSLLIGLPLLILILKKNNEYVAILKNIEKWYRKVPLDIQLIIFIIYMFIMMKYINKVVFFSKPYRFGQVYILTIVAVYILYLVINVKQIIYFKGNRNEFRIGIKKCLVNKLLSRIRENSKFQSIKFKTKIMTTLTLLLGLITLGVFACIKNSREGFVIVIAISYILFYMIFMIYYIFKIGRFVIGIAKGTEEIVLGNLNYTIEEKGRGELLKIANNINNMKAGVKEALKSEMKSERLKSELITNVSHDLKTPLTSIINYVGLLKKEGISNEEADRYINVLDRKSQRLKVIIDDLFEASKMASGAVDLEIEKLEVTSLLKQTLGEFDEAINNSELTFRLKFPEEKVYANLDGKKTWRVFENLINNILKYSQPGTRVYISLKEEDGKIVITMKNTSSYEMDFESEEIFERFKRGDKSRSTEGTGLGLSIAKSILEIQGGELSIKIDGDLFKAKIIIPSIDE